MKGDILDIASTVCKVIGYILLALAAVLHILATVMMMRGFGTFVEHFPNPGEIFMWLAMLLYYLPGLGFLVVGQKLDE